MTDSDTHQVEEGWVELSYGTAFPFFASPAEMAKHITLREVAYSLSRQCRYTGHTKRHYSVAEHCIIFADHVEREGGSPRECLTALHHDDAEFVIGDMARPIKVTMPSFKALEVTLDQASAIRFNTIYPFPKWIKDMDARMIRSERDAVMRPSSNDWGVDNLKPIDVRFMSIRGRWSWFMRRAFISRHHKWTAQRPVADLMHIDMAQPVFG